MTNWDKFYKLALNMLDHYADIKFSYDIDKEKYEPVELFTSYGKCDLELRLNQGPYMTWVKFTNNNLDQTYLAIVPVDLDEVFDAIRVSYMDFMLEGIE